MAFNFPFDSLLRLRRSQQRQQELVLQRKNHEVNRLQVSLTCVETEMAAISAQLSHGRSGAEIEFDREQLRALSVHHRAIEEELLRATVERYQVASEFRRAWQNRETLETLRLRARVTFALGQARHEQRALDDWFLVRKRTR